MRDRVLAADVVDSFTDVVVKCLRATVGVDAVLAAVGEPPGALATIAVAVDLGGDVRGPVTWVFPAEIALELVRRLLADPDPAPETVTDGATELANILTGCATDALESHGFRCNLGVPRVHLGELPSGLTVHMVTGAGPIDLVLSLSSI
jgi:CheY-specific phosphatase CheX